jgi:hypothetical protein
MAEEQQKVEIYAEVIENEATLEQYEQVAEYFERHRKNFLAGKYFYLAGNHRKVSLKVAFMAITFEITGFSLSSFCSAMEKTTNLSKLRLSA